MQTTRQTALSATARPTAARAAEPKPLPATAPQPLDANLLKWVGGAGTALPVHRW